MFKFRSNTPKRNIQNNIQVFYTIYRKQFEITKSHPNKNKSHANKNIQDKTAVD